MFKNDKYLFKNFCWVEILKPNNKYSVIPLLIKGDCLLDICSGKEYKHDMGESMLSDSSFCVTKDMYGDFSKDGKVVGVYMSDEIEGATYKLLFREDGKFKLLFGKVDKSVYNYDEWLNSTTISFKQAKKIAKLYSYQLTSYGAEHHKKSISAKKAFARVKPYMSKNEIYQLKNDSEREM